MLLALALLPQRQGHGPSIRELSSSGLSKEAKEWSQGRGNVVSEKRIQSPKELQEHNERTGTADNLGVAGTEDISCGAWPDTELPSYILQVQECNPHSPIPFGRKRTLWDTQE